HTMAKFSVDRLSQSFHHISTERVDVEEGTQYGRHGIARSRMPCVVGDDSEGESALHRRMRTKFTSDQICRLEQTFNKHKYLGPTQRRKNADKMKLSETQVKTWFQNRRMKLKHEVQDMSPEFFALPASLLPPLVYAAALSLQHHALGGQLPTLRAHKCCTQHNALINTCHYRHE
uniref:Homeobox domain-containing protein n=1 Tax=Hucho hucho TaxID=62062 RepID=A0A4W5LGG9_9TELE